MKVSSKVKWVAFIDSIFEHGFDRNLVWEIDFQIEELTFQDCQMSSTVFHNLQFFLENMTINNPDNKLKMINVIGSDNIMLKELIKTVNVSMNYVFKLKP